MIRQLREGLKGVDAGQMRDVDPRLRARLGHRHGKERDAGDGPGGARAPPGRPADAVHPAVANDTLILYGGSVKPGNVDGLMAMSDVDGVLVGGASLDEADFHRIVWFETKPKN